METTHQRAEYLAETYADAILRLCYAYLKNTHDAQDICQTVFVKLLTEPNRVPSKVPSTSGHTCCAWRQTPAKTC